MHPNINLFRKLSVKTVIFKSVVLLSLLVNCGGGDSSNDKIQNDSLIPNTSIVWDQILTEDHVYIDPYGNNAKPSAYGYKFIGISDNIFAAHYDVYIYDGEAEEYIHDYYLILANDQQVTLPGWPVHIDGLGCSNLVANSDFIATIYAVRNESIEDDPYNWSKELHIFSLSGESLYKEKVEEQNDMDILFYRGFLFWASGPKLIRIDPNTGERSVFEAYYTEPESQEKYRLDYSLNKLAAYGDKIIAHGDGSYLYVLTQNLEQLALLETDITPMTMAVCNNGVAYFGNFKSPNDNDWENDYKYMRLTAIEIAESAGNHDGIEFNTIYDNYFEKNNCPDGYCFWNYPQLFSDDKCSETGPLISAYNQIGRLDEDGWPIFYQSIPESSSSHSVFYKDGFINVISDEYGFSKTEVNF